MINHKKLLLILLPFWDPLIPPLGLACLKGALTEHGHRVVTVDANVEPCFRDIYDRYFQQVEGFLPRGKGGHMLNVGMELLQNHLMAHWRKEKHDDYIHLVRIMFAKTFGFELSLSQAETLNQIIEQFFVQLEEYMNRQLSQHKPEILGFSVYGGTLPASLYAAALARQWAPDLEILVGGGVFAEQLAPGSGNMNRFLEETRHLIDHVFIGEGELLLEKYLNGELDPGQRVYAIADIGNDTLDLASSVLPDFSDLELSHYPALSSYSSRSCPFRCSFCSETVQWGKFRKKDVSRVVDELRRLYRLHGRQLFLMGDSLMNHIVSPLAQALLESDVAMYWDGYLRISPEAAMRENTFLWRKGGFYRARLGIESGSQRLLDAMGKKITLQQIKDAVSALAESGIKTTTMWIIGYPGETEEDFQQTLDLLEEMKEDVYQADCNIFRYFVEGQANSPGWARDNELLYPAWAGDMLLVDTFVVKGTPSREETIARLDRFMQHCAALGIPNPYTMRQLHQADLRWRSLHVNAVPSLLDLVDGGGEINECRNVELSELAANTLDDEGDFCL